MTTTTTRTRYLVIDAPGHHGDWIRVYRVSATLDAARRYIAGSPLYAIAADTTGAYVAKGQRISRATPLHYVR